MKRLCLCAALLVITSSAFANAEMIKLECSVQNVMNDSSSFGVINFEGAIDTWKIFNTAEKSVQLAVGSQGNGQIFVTVLNGNGAGPLTLGEKDIEFAVPTAKGSMHVKCAKL